MLQDVIKQVKKELFDLEHKKAKLKELLKTDTSFLSQEYLDVMKQQLNHMVSYGLCLEKRLRMLKNNTSTK